MTRIASRYSQPHACIVPAGPRAPNGFLSAGLYCFRWSGLPILQLRFSYDVILVASARSALGLSCTPFRPLLALASELEVVSAPREVPAKAPRWARVDPAKWPSTPARLESYRCRSSSTSTEPGRGELVGNRDVIERGLDVFDELAVVLHRFQRALVLMQERQGANQREVLRKISASSRAVIKKGERLRERVGDEQRPQESLRILMQLEQLRLLAALQ